MEQTKRMAENYEITNAFHIGDKEVVFGVDEHSENPFFCGFCEKENLIVMVRERYTECMVGNDYIGMLELFADRVKQLTEKVRAERAKITVPREPITPDMCYPNDYDKSIVDEVVAIRKTVFRPNIRAPTVNLYMLRAVTEPRATHTAGRVSARTFTPEKNYGTSVTRLRA